MEEQFGGQLRVGSYNIAHGRGTGSELIDNFRGGGRDARRSRLSAIADLIRRENLDLVVLNEIDFSAVPSWWQKQARVLADEAGFPYWVEQRNYDASVLFFDYKSGNAVLSKFPITAAELIRYPIGRATERALFGEKRGVLCSIELQPDLEIRLLAVHLDHKSEAARVRSAELIERIREKSSLPLVLAGDFNSTPRGFPGHVSDHRGRSAVQLLLDAGAYRTAPMGVPIEGDYTFSSLHPEKVIDWILVPRVWRIAEKRVINSQLSDHFPVVLVAEIPSF